MATQPSQHRVIFGDARTMPELPDQSVHLVVTSPPYWQLKDYENGNQIGFNDSYEDYINNLNLVWAECDRVLHSGCRLCINIGDQFARSVYYGRYKIIPIRTEIIRFCETIGLDYMGAVIWQKVTTCNTTGGATVMGSFPYPRNGILKLDYEFILIFKKQGQSPKVSRSVKEECALTTEEWNTFFHGHWNFPGERQAAHIAAFPEELPRRLIRMFSFMGETVLDPFLGSGTTTLAALKLSRSSVGYEINSESEAIIRQRLGLDTKSMFDQSPVEIVHRPNGDRGDVSQAFQRLPYVFRDPVRLDRKVDPHRLTFGSKINTRTPSREEYQSIRNILSPQMIELASGLRIRLLGVRPNPDRQSEALEYLGRILSGQKVFLRFDQIKHDNENTLLCYLYLSNRLFINGRLIQEGYADIDDEYPFSKRTLFQRYLRKS